MKKQAKSEMKRLRWEMRNPGGKLLEEPILKDEGPVERIHPEEVISRK